MTVPHLTEGREEEATTPSNADKKRKRKEMLNLMHSFSFMSKTVLMGEICNIIDIH
jgi:hypothetical protein